MIGLFENEFCKLGFHEENKVVFLRWKPFKTINFEDYKKPYLISLEYQKINEVFGILVDSKEQGVIPPAFRKWFQEFAVKEGIENGLKRAAVVSEANVFKRYYFNHILNSASKFGFEIKVYPTLDEALAWIKKPLS